jgi:hypothetical protein
MYDTENLATFDAPLHAFAALYNRAPYIRYLGAQNLFGETLDNVFS